MDSVVAGMREQQADAQGALEVRLRCIHRRGSSTSIERVGIEVDGQVRHFHPASVVFALKTKKWRLLANSWSAGRDFEVVAGCDAYGRDTLMPAPNDPLGRELFELYESASH